MDILLHDTYFASSSLWLPIAVFFALGAAFGSFFNVVAYRLPRGMSLSKPGSRCPQCGHPIRWYDNVPIVGWLWLRGRCRDCGAAISPRYPLVELLVAAASALVAWSEIVPTASGEGFAFDYSFGARLLVVYALCIAALVEWDGNAAPLWLLAVVSGAGIGLAVWWPEALPAADRTTSLLGLGAGTALGLVAWPLLVEATDRPGVRKAAARVVEVALVGVFLGLPAAVLAAVPAAVVSLAFRFGWAAVLAAGTLVWSVAGDRIAPHVATAGDDATKVLVAAAIVAGCAIAARALGPGGRT